MAVLFTLFSFSFCILILYYLFIFSRLSFSKSPDHRISESSVSPVSVIICARNEIDNLRHFLPSILNQDYEKFEVIVVNDRSTDGSLKWLDQMTSKYPYLKVITNAEENLPGKRNALKKGLEAARHDIILLTDADCSPASNEWIKHMTAALTPETEIVLGYSPCAEQKEWFNRFIRYENFQTGLYYLSFALSGMPYMGTGRNLLYRTPVTRNIRAIEHHSSLISGDDDLTVNRIATNRNTKLMIHPKSFVTTIPPDFISSFFRQKRRHYTTGLYYQPKHQIALGLLYGAQTLFNLSLIPLILSSYSFTALISIFIIKNILQTLIYGKAMQRLNVQNLWIFTPLLDLCFTVFFLTLSGLSLFKPKTWK